MYWTVLGGAGLYLAALGSAGVPGGRGPGGPGGQGGQDYPPRLYAF